MKTTVQQEILLMTGTTFSSRQCWQKNEENNQSYSEAEQLLEACWNGVLPEILPEICEPANQNKKLYLWQIRENKSSIEIDLGETPDDIVKDFSIDPYAFLSVQLMS